MKIYGEEEEKKKKKCKKKKLKYLVWRKKAICTK